MIIYNLKYYVREKLSLADYMDMSNPEFPKAKFIFEENFSSPAKAEERQKELFNAAECLNVAVKCIIRSVELK
jgi:hypothetical protein